MNIIVAIDGPAASGKSTVARRVAAELGFVYVDSGSFYRGVTWAVLRQKVPAGDIPGIMAVLHRIHLEHYQEGNAVCFRIDGINPGLEIRREAVAERVSEVAAQSEVRRVVNSWLRATSALGSIVMEGRDIGSVVFPETPYKFYLDADPSERARRRFSELEARQETVEQRKVQDALLRRDERDSSRPEAPLRIASGAEVIDTTALNIDQVVDKVIQRVRQKTV